MQTLLNVASIIATPLSLMAFVASIFLLFAKQLLSILPAEKVASKHVLQILNRIVDKFFTLSLVTLMLAFTGFVMTLYATPRGPEEIHIKPMSEESKVVIRGTLNFYGVHETVYSEESRTGVSPTIRLKQTTIGGVREGTTQVVLSLPDSATNIEPKAYWTTGGADGGKKTDISINGTQVIAKGWLRADPRPFGTNTWGEVHLEVKYKMPSKKLRPMEPVDLPEILMTGKQTEVAFNNINGDLSAIHLKFFSPNNIKIDELKLIIPEEIKAILTQLSEKGLFQVSVSDNGMIITRTTSQ